MLFNFKKIVFFFLFSLYSFNLWAETPTKIESIIDSPDLITEDLITELVQLLQKKENNFDEVALFLDQKMASYIDFDYLIRWSTGKDFRYLTPQQKQRLNYQFKRMVLTAISDRFTGYPLTQIKFLPITKVTEEQATAPVLLQEVEGQSDILNFRFYPSKTGWKIFDISHNGHSLLNFYRQYFDKARH